MNFRPLLALCSGLMAMAALPAAAQPVSVSRITFDGWSDCLRISNGIVEAVVVPQIGRVMEFQYVGQPNTNALFANQAMLGKPASAAGAHNWANFGGDKLWPSPQSEWPLYMKSTWPPDPAFDGTPEHASIVPGGVRLTTDASAVFGLQSVRTFTMRAGRPRLYVNQVLRRTSAPHWVSGMKAPVTAEQKEVGIWSVTQFRPDAAFIFPANPHSKFPEHFATFGSDGTPNMAGSVMPHTVKRFGEVFVVRHDHSASFKVAFDSRTGYAAALFGPGILFTEHFPRYRGATYPDRGSSLEAWSNPDPAYDELEMLGPVANVPVGGSIRYPIYWQLDRLREVPADDAGTAATVARTEARR